MTNNGNSGMVIPIRVIVWILGSAGISGVIVALGFVVDVGYQERLGYQLHHGRAMSAYLVAGGNFIMTIFFHVAEWLADYSSVWVPVLLIAIAGATFYRRIGHDKLRGVRTRYERLPSRGVFLLICLLISLEILALDFPALQIRGLLLHGLEAPSNTDRDLFQYTGSERIWTTTVCARFDKALYADLAQINVLCDASPQSHNKFLRNLFLLNFFLTGILLYFSIAHSFRKITPNTVQTTVLALLNVLNIAFLPYTYGKILHPTTFNEVILHIAETNDSAKGEHGFLLSRDDKVVVIFHKEERHIWVIPAEKVVLTKLERQGDVLQYYFKRVVTETQNAPEPPI